MPRIESHREIGTAALLVGIVNGRVCTLEVRTDRRRPVPSGRESEYAELAGIDMPFGGMIAHEAERSLGVLERQRCGRSDVALALRIPVRSRFGHTILHQYARDPLRDQPVAHLRALEIDRELVVTPTRKD